MCEEILIVGLWKKIKILLEKPWAHSAEWKPLNDHYYSILKSFPNSDLSPNFPVSVNSTTILPSCRLETRVYSQAPILVSLFFQVLSDSPFIWVSQSLSSSQCLSPSGKEMFSLLSFITLAVCFCALLSYPSNPNHPLYHCHTLLFKIPLKHITPLFKIPPTVPILSQI